jgi:hypothetical protein
MLETNETCSLWLNVVCQIINLFEVLSNCGDLLQYADDLKFLGSAQYWASLQKTSKVSQLKVNYLGHIVILGNLLLLLRRWTFLKLGSPKKN